MSDHNRKVVIQLVIVLFLIFSGTTFCLTILHTFENSLVQLLGSWQTKSSESITISNSDTVVIIAAEEEFILYRVWDKEKQVDCYIAIHNKTMLDEIRKGIDSECVPQGTLPSQ